jgi:hypothetical protein
MAASTKDENFAKTWHRIQKPFSILSNESFLK